MIYIGPYHLVNIQIVSSTYIFCLIGSIVLTIQEFYNKKKSFYVYLFLIVFKIPSFALSWIDILVVFFF